MPLKRFTAIALCSLSLTLGLTGQKPAGTLGRPAAAKVQAAAFPPGTSMEARIDPGRLPLSFVPLEQGTGYVVQGRDKAVFFTPEGVTIALADARGNNRPDKVVTFGTSAVHNCTAPPSISDRIVIWISELLVLGKWGQAWDVFGQSTAITSCSVTLEDRRSWKISCWRSALMLDRAHLRMPQLLQMCCFSLSHGDK